MLDRTRYHANPQMTSGNRPWPLELQLTLTLHSSSSFLSFHQESYVRQMVPSGLPMLGTADGDAVSRCQVFGRAGSVGQTSRCCMLCLMPQSHVSCSLENPHFNIFTLDRPTCVRNRLRAFQVVQGFSAPAGRCSSGLMLRCTLGARVVLSIAPYERLSPSC